MPYERCGKRYQVRKAYVAKQDRRMLFSAGTVIPCRRSHRCRFPIRRDILCKSRDGRLSLNVPGCPAFRSGQIRHRPAIRQRTSLPDRWYHPVLHPLRKFRCRTSIINLKSTHQTATEHVTKSTIVTNLTPKHNNAIHLVNICSSLN